MKAGWSFGRKQRVEDAAFKQEDQSGLVGAVGLFWRRGWQAWTFGDFLGCGCFVLNFFAGTMRLMLSFFR